MSVDLTEGAKNDQYKSALWLVPWEYLKEHIPKHMITEAFELYRWSRRDSNSDEMMSKLGMPQLLDIAKILDFGAKKYAPDNWQKGIKFTRIVSAGLRHATAQEETDQETGFPHLYHFHCNLMFAAFYDENLERYESFDDRPSD